MLTWLPGAGRVGNIRSGGKGLVFYDLFGEGQKVQIFANAQKFTEFAGMEKDEVSTHAPRAPLVAGGGARLRPGPSLTERPPPTVQAIVAFMKLANTIKRGDIVGVVGQPGKTKRGELSIFPTELQLLTPCLHMMPKTTYGVHRSTVGPDARPAEHPGLRRSYLPPLSSPVAPHRK